MLTNKAGSLGWKRWSDFEGKLLWFKDRLVIDPNRTAVGVF